MERMRPQMREMSPEAGEFDEQAVRRALRDDADEALVTLAEAGATSDVKLRAYAKRMAARVVMELTSGQVSPRRGVDRLARRPLSEGGDIDLDASLDAVVAGRALGQVPDPDRLVSRSWIRSTHALSLIVDRSGSMAGERLVAAALGAAVVACRAPGDYSVLAIAGDVVVIKSQDEERSLDAVIDDILALKGYGTTDLALGLRAAGRQLARSRSSRRVAVLLSDAESTAGGDPLEAARRLDRLHVICPPGNEQGARELAQAGSGRSAVLARPTAIPQVMMHLVD